MYVNNDEFGINDFRKSFNYIYEANTTQVKRHSKSEYNQEYQSGDFLGLTTAPKEDKDELININIMSINPNKKALKQTGYSDKGIVEYKGCCSYDQNIHHMDTIEFISQNNQFSITEGEQFRIIMDDEGLYQGQFCYKFFKMVKI